MGFDLGRFSGKYTLHVTILIDLIIFVCRTYTLIIQHFFYSIFCSFSLCTIIGEVDEELICPICSQVLEEPVQVFNFFFMKVIFNQIAI